MGQRREAELHFSLGSLGSLVVYSGELTLKLEAELYFSLVAYMVQRGAGVRRFLIVNTAGEAEDRSSLRLQRGRKTSAELLRLRNPRNMNKGLNGHEQLQCQ